jgi:hypothetical protein
MLDMAVADWEMPWQGSLHTPVHVAACTAAVFIPQAPAVASMLSAQFPVAFTADPS